MEKIILLFVFCSMFVASNGLQATNYDISRNYNLQNSNGFLKQIADFLLGGGYYGGQYGGNYPYPQGPGLYPSGPGYPGQYPGSNYPVNPGQVGPPGAHPGCPLCDSSVYSYCYQKQAHDACCCENPSFGSYGCRRTDCKFLYANSCQEYNLISRCCCVDLQKSNEVLPQPLGVVGKK